MSQPSKPLVPTKAAQNYWSLIQNYFLIKGPTKETASFGTYYTSSIGYTGMNIADVNFTFPSYTPLNAECPYNGDKQCSPILSGNTFCHDRTATCNLVDQKNSISSNYSTFLGMMHEITAEYSCAYNALNGNGGGCTDPINPKKTISLTMSKAQLDFYSSFLFRFNQVISIIFSEKLDAALQTYDPTWNYIIEPANGVAAVLSGSDVPTQPNVSPTQMGVLSNLNKELANHGATIPYGINLP